MYIFWLSLVALVASVTAAKDGCTGFRITSPIVPNQRWTHGRCYSVDWDNGNSKATFIRAVQIISNATQTAVATLAENVPVAQGTTGNVPLIIPDNALAKTGQYYFSVDVVTPEEVCRLSTVPFHLNVNPNSPPADHC